MSSRDPFQLPGEPIHDKDLPGYHARSFEAHFADEAGSTITQLRFITDRRRIRYGALFGIAVLLILAGRLFHLQVFEGWIYRASAEENRIAIQDVPAARGLIYDRNGEVLVRNVPTFSIELVPSELPSDTTERQAILTRLSSSLNLSVEELESTIDHSDQDYFAPITLVSGLDYDKALHPYIELSDVHAVQLHVDASRSYIGGTTFSHVLGYMRKLTKPEYDNLESEGYAYNDVIGKTGIEASFESALRGENGKRRVEVDVLKNQQNVIAETDPIPGQDVILGIDAGLQRTLQESLERAMTETKSPGGSAVAIDPRNGEIRALVNAPTFDNNLFAGEVPQAAYTALIEDERKPLFARAWSGQFPSGSIIKPVWAASALQEGTITTSTKVLSTGAIHVGPWNFPDWKPGGHGLVEVKEAIGWSVNTFFYALGGGYEHVVGLGVEKMKHYGERFGLNQVLGLDLPGEASGFLPSPEWKKETKGEGWYIGDTYHLSIGQGDLLVTPLQMATSTAAIANGGTLWKPHVVSNTAQEGVSMPVDPVAINQQVVDAQHIQTVREGMRYTVLSGSAQRMQQLPVTSGAKTGTAQFDASDQTHAWFTAFAPYENPELVIAILLEKGGQGSVTALPIAMDAFRYYFQPHP